MAKRRRGAQAPGAQKSSATMAMRRRGAEAPGTKKSSAHIVWQLPIRIAHWQHETTWQWHEFPAAACQCDYCTPDIVSKRGDGTS